MLAAVPQTLRAIPAELRELTQWVAWRGEERDGNRMKVPYRADGSGRASTSDRASWATFEDAVAASAQADGIGFVFSAEDPFVGVDLDHCFAGDDLLHPDAAAAVLALDSYTERSVSGDGVHVFIRASLTGSRNRTGKTGWGGSFEVYDAGRFFCVTGRHERGTPARVEERQNGLESVLAFMLPPVALEAVATPAVVEPLDLPDEELLDRARQARNGASFDRLYRGDCSGFPSHSEADLALAGALAFWTGRDPNRIDRLFRSSGLMRPKWDSRRGERTYGSETIAAALRGRRDFYQPAAKSEPESPPTSERREREPDHEPTPEVPQRLVGRMHRDVLAEPIPESAQLVADVADAGTVGLIAGLPFARKSFLLHELEFKVAGGGGLVLGRFPVTRPGPVVAVWQDDSTANELARVQAYAAAHHDYPEDLPIRWLLNEGVRLPDDVDQLAEIVATDEAVLLGVDSLYNVLSPEVGVREDDVAQILAGLKRGVCDTTGATVAVVDHAPWPTESNRGQRRAFGSVFKTAAVRWSVHLAADSSDETKLWVEATGNNVAGFRRTPAFFDPETLEICLRDVEAADQEALEAEVLAYITSHAGKATSAIATALGKSPNTVRPALERLSEPGPLARVMCKRSHDLGTPGTGRYWFPLNQAGIEPPQLFQTTQDQSPLSPSKEGDGSEPSPPRRGDGWTDHSLDGQQPPAGGLTCAGDASVEIEVAE